MKDYSWIIEYSDEEKEKRLERMKEKFYVYSCKKIMKWNRKWKKGLNNGKDIDEIKKMI